MTKTDLLSRLRTRVSALQEDDKNRVGPLHGLAIRARMAFNDAACGAFGCRWMLQPGQHGMDVCSRCRRTRIIQPSAGSEQVVWITPDEAEKLGL